MEIDANEKEAYKLLSKDNFIKVFEEKAENGQVPASFCCVYLSISNFRRFYMRKSFDEGYEVLTFVSRKILDAFPVDPVARIEDGEYAVITDIDEIEVFIKRIQKDFDEVYVHTGMNIIAGIYPITDVKESADDIIQNAKIACQNSVTSVHGIAVFDKEQIDEKVLMQHYVVHHLETAIENGEIKVYYQPIYHTLSEKICGFEALARWINPEYGLLYPTDFVPVLEKSKKIYILDSFVIRQVIKDEREVLDKGLDAVPISINLTRLDFALVDILGILEEEMNKNRIPVELIKIEICEADIATGKNEVKDVLFKLHEKGFKITYDDFGSEFSSLHALNEMPFDSIKINSSFLSGFDKDLRSRIVMKNVFNMAKELGIETMMGSVEDGEILEFLKQTGCDKSQGHLFSEAAALDEANANDYVFENKPERVFYDEVAAVNILSQTPIDTNSTYLENEATYLNQLPLAIFEYDGDKIRFLMSSRGFDEIIKALFVENANTVEKVFNGTRNTFANQIRDLASQCVDDEIHTMEFVTSEGFNRIMLRRITTETDNSKMAIIAIVEKMSEDDPDSRAVKLNSYLRFLYMIYNRVNIVNVDEDSFETLYENKSKYNFALKEGKFSDAILKFSDEAVYNEDREDFREFYNLETIDQRVTEFTSDHITNYFRTKDKNGEYDWLMYLIIPIVSEGNRMFIMCSRTIEAERMRKLPEISQSGSEYYDMPSDPAFLLLASDAFTNTLGYGSFEQFLRKTYYLEASLTDDLTIYMHLGQSGLISDYGETGYISLPFSEVLKGKVFGQVQDEDKDKMYEFYDRDRLLAEYEKGNTSGTIVYLERKGTSNKPRYNTACYHIRKSRDEDNVHIYLLTYDIDDFYRTNEKIRFLAERDTLTGLYNRTTIGKLVESFMEDEDTKNFAIVLLDLDYFKHINDGYGHDCGDRVLKDASERMMEYMGKDSHPARIGGDEFLVVIRNKSEKEIHDILRNFSTMEKKIVYGEKEVKYSMSIGFSMYPNDGKEYNELYKNADKALYEVKMNGRDNYGQYKENDGE